MKLNDGLVIVALALVVGLITACEQIDTPVTSSAVQPTSSPVLPATAPMQSTVTPVPPTDKPEPPSCAEVEGNCLVLTFDGESCTYQGPTELRAGPVTLVFRNESDVVAASKLLRLWGDKTSQDLIEYYGEGPFTHSAPPWSATVLPGIREPIGVGGSHRWEGTLEPGIHGWVCGGFMPDFTGWLGAAFTVEE
jgi:hypothetical protein